jgi:hypothetical protein
MPGDLNSPGDNPFFLGHHESYPPPQGDNPPRGPFKPARPLDSIWMLVKKMAPDLTRHDRDLLSHRMDLEGVTEQFGKPGFEEKLKFLIQEIAGSPSRVVSKYISSRRATNDAEEHEET